MPRAKTSRKKARGKSIDTLLKSVMNKEDKLNALKKEIEEEKSKIIDEQKIILFNLYIESGLEWNDFIDYIKKSLENKKMEEEKAKEENTISSKELDNQTNDNLNNGGNYENN